MFSVLKITFLDKLKGLMNQPQKLLDIQGSFKTTSKHHLFPREKKNPRKIHGKYELNLRKSKIKRDY